MGARLLSMQCIQDEEMDAILLIDVSNAFKVLNRVAVLHNIRVL